MRRVLQILVSLGGLVVLVALGLWQLSRAEWKDEVIATMEARLGAEAIPLPSDPDPDAHAFRAVALTGRVTGEGVPVFSTWRGAGPGWRVIAPFETDDGRRLLLDRGWVRDPETADVPAERIAVEGHLHWTQEVEGSPGDGFEARDVDLIAARLGTEPLLVVASAVSAPAGVAPVPLDSAGIPDNHLGYAVQWFGLAAVWAGMAALWFRRRRA